MSGGFHPTFPCCSWLAWWVRVQTALALLLSRQTGPPQGGVMPTSKRSKVSSTASSASSVDTSRWEKLLSAGSRNSKDAAPVTAGRLGHRISITAPHAAVTSKLATRDRSTPAVPPKPLARGTDRLPTKRKEKGSGSRGGAGVESSAWPTNNWQTLLGGGNAAEAAAAPTATAAAATTTANNGGPNAHAGKTKHKNKNKRNTKKQPEFENGTAIRGVAAAPSPPDQQQSPPGATASKPRAGDLLSGGNGAGKAGKKRKRKGADSAAASFAPGTSAAGTGGEHFQSKRPFSSWSSPAEVTSGNNRPRSNVLNLAFQASKDGAGGGQQDGAKRGRGKGAGGGGKGAKKGSQQVLTAAEEAQYVGLDCEMVGVGPAGCRSALARCCIVDWNGNVIYDKHVTPNERVTDFRTFVSGVKASHLKGNFRLRECQEEVAAIVKGKVLIGHALHNDLKALMMSHPSRMTRDTATYRPYQKAHGRAGGKLRAKSLKMLTEELLGRTIQSGQHSPAEDASAAMDLYKFSRSQWEKSLSAASNKRARRTVVDQGAP